MKTHALSIPEPCPVAWSEMEGDERRRFCAQCDKHVTQISRMTKREARTFLTNAEDVCVQMEVFGDEVLFEPEPVRQGGLLRRRVWRRAAMVGAGLAFAAPAMASSSAESGSLVEWVASWFTGDASTDEGKTQVEPQVEPEVAPPVVEHLILGGAPRLPPEWEEERLRNLEQKHPGRVEKKRRPTRKPTPVKRSVDDGSLIPELE